jgi:integrase
LIDHWESTHIDSKQRIRLSDLHALQLSQKQKAGLGERYLADLERFGLRIVADFTDAYIDSITGSQILEWLNSATGTDKRHKGELWSGKTRKEYLSYLRDLINRAMAMGAIKQDPVVSILKADLSDTLKHYKADTEILTVSQAEKLLRYCEEKRREWLPVVVLGLFAGVRQNEIRQLSWEDISFKRGSVRISKEIAKSRNIRNATLRGKAEAWLRLCPNRKGPLARGTDKTFSKHFSAMVREAGISPWPHNGLRHSFASYAYEVYGEEPTRKQLGHTSKNEDQLFENYRDLVRDEDAAKYFEISPKADAQTIPFPSEKTG